MTDLRPFSRFGLGLSLLLAAALPASVTLGQTPTAPAPVREPLPPFRFESPGETRSRNGRYVAEGGARLVWGDATLTADTITFDARTGQAEAVGSAVFTRGDESIRGERIRLNGETGIITVDSAIALTPPFRIEGRSLYRDLNTFRVLDASLGLRPEEGGEVALRADEIRLSNASRLTLRNAKVYLYGRKLFTLRHVTIPITLDPEYGGTGQSTRPPPVTFRVSGISGQAIGFGNQFGVFPGTTLGIQFEQTTRQGFQYTFSTRTLLVGPRVEERGRPLTASPGGRGERIQERRQRLARGEKVDDVPQVSPVRQLLTARVPPPEPDQVLDFVDILSTANPLSRPTRAQPRFVSLLTTYAHNREFGGRRQSPLLLSREPEIQVAASIPLYRPVEVTSTEETRRDLRSPRYFALGQIETGRYGETRLKEDIAVPAVNGGRFGAVVGAGTLPILVGSRTLLYAQSALHFSRYDQGQTYTYSETNLAAEYIFKPRSGIGAALIRRITTGETPFLFDQIDTQNEAQLRFQTTGGKGSRFTFALLGRFDVTQGTLFDVEFAVARRGYVLEPRFTYKRLNRQFGFSVALIGLSQR